jgi:hypothetical protein
MTQYTACVAFNIVLLCKKADKSEKAGEANLRSNNVGCRKHTDGDESSDKE